MLNQLLETKPVRQRRTGGTLVSFVLHALVIAVVVGVTRENVRAFTKPEEHPVVVRQPLEPKPEPVHRAPAPNALHSATPAPLGPPVLTAPVTVEVGIPPVDLGASPTNAGDFVGVGVAGGRPDGEQGGGGPASGDVPMQLFEVDKAAAMLPGSPTPAYPASLKSSGVEGEALVQFVVDTTGRAEVGSFRVLETTHEAFGASVRTTLARMRFVPAEAGGKKVRMLVQQRFAFALVR